MNMSKEKAIKPIKKGLSMNQSRIEYVDHT